MACFYYFMPKEFKDLEANIDWDGNERVVSAKGRSKQKQRRTKSRLPGEEYDLVEGEDDLDLDEEIRTLERETGLGVQKELRENGSKGGEGSKGKGDGAAVV